jgi:hypothetical protein
VDVVAEEREVGDRAAILPAQSIRHVCLR